MTHIYRWLWIAVIFVSGGISIDAQQNIPPDFAPIEQFITQQLAEQATPGLAIAVYHQGRTIYRNGFGLRDKETDAEDASHLLLAESGHDLPRSHWLLQHRYRDNLLATPE